MCGIAGMIGSPDRESLGSMAEALRHRGPDDQGIWIDPEGIIGLAHTRLAILDLTEAGHQPMVSDDRNRVLVFNGEIYNHLELRVEIEQSCASRWRGHSDTETLLVAFERWGVEATLQKCRGMFAFAFWDRESQSLTLGRDRLGEKPLYYGRQGNNFFFASDLSALCAHPRFSKEMNREALGAYLSYGYVPAPLSIYQGIQKLLPGTLVTVQKGELEASKPTPYWSLVEMAARGQTSPFAGTENDALQILEELIGASVQRQKLSDVPLGAFLSGGIDSSLVTAFLQRHSSKQALTYTIGFEEKSHDEASQARSVAQILGTDHHELYLSPDMVLAMIPGLASIHSEPFSDPSQLPTLLLSQFAKHSVSVTLSGDGGDEFFCGYSRYHHFATIGSIPGFVRSPCASILTSLSPEGWDSLISGLGRLYTPLAGREFLGDKMHKMARLLKASDVDAMYIAFLSQNSAVQSFSNSGNNFIFLEHLRRLRKILPLPQSRLMAFDAMTYLPDDILCKVDRAAMAVSLETRVPLLDHELVEFAMTLPVSMNVRNGQGKWLLRKLLMKYLPQHLVERPKRGFAVPIAEWLRGPLKIWAEELLEERLLRQSGLFDPLPIRAKWKEHLAGTRNWHYQLWNILMLQGWLRASKII